MFLHELLLSSTGIFFLNIQLVVTSQAFKNGEKLLPPHHWKLSSVTSNELRTSYPTFLKYILNLAQRAGTSYLFHKGHLMSGRPNPDYTHSQWIWSQLKTKLLQMNNVHASSKFCVIIIFLLIWTLFNINVCQKVAKYYLYYGVEVNAHAMM